MSRTNRTEALQRITDLRDGLPAKKSEKQIGESLGLRGNSTRDVAAEIAALGLSTEVALSPVAEHNQKARKMAELAGSTPPEPELEPAQRQLERGTEEWFDARQEEKRDNNPYAA